ncbi:MULTISPECIES: hypothetical protein [Sorangium]|uniref:Glycoside hydrolase family 5 domain-containing protein n=1 Tax=Sorangium cellulosum (strain So ce56) TaxID=448385 RepID=A9ERN2_SORC5|nr:hypothetical protein [Sorangium cellulosum]CAN97311.1 hypothetical protein predicted by Glimmer/Critica [Sorangium cellulosum So ce56]
MRRWSVLLCASAVVACGSGDDSPGYEESGGGDISSGGGGSAGGGGSGGNGGSGGLPHAFRYGANLGHRNADWGDDKEATLAARAGVRSLRIKLPAAHFARWGYEIEVGDIQSYASLGMADHIGFLIGSESVDLTVAPADAEDWQNEYYIPKSLYEPIFSADGTVNPGNAWASYVYRTVDTYKPWVKLWHVWNEPDWVADWRVTETWRTEPPKAADLPRFNGSIFDYIRMLRVTKEAARKADPDARIATGGIGYPSFLSAILRYTDNPDGGAVTPDYPEKGGAYIDVLDFHYYPIFSPKSSDASVDDFLASKDAFAATLADAGVEVQGWNVSENGAPLARTPEYPEVGSPEYARNYLIKMMTMAQAHGVGGVDWFILSNGEDGSDDVFAHMGLYNDVGALASVDEATKTDLGKAYTTLNEVLFGTSYDDSATRELALPGGARGAVFTKDAKDGKRRIALWAVTASSTEDASASVELATATGFEVHAWDGAKTSADASGGKATVALSGSPVLLIER